MTFAMRGGREPSPSRLRFGGAFLDAAIGISLPIVSDIAAPWQLRTRALRHNLAVPGRTKDAAP